MSASSSVARLPQNPQSMRSQNLKGFHGSHQNELGEARHPDVALERVKQVASRFEVDIPIIDMDYQKNILYAASSTKSSVSSGVINATGTTSAAAIGSKRAFYELNSNIWKERGSSAAYLGTGRHGGGIMLRIMFVRVDGHWVNVATGQPAPFSEKEFDF